MARPWTRQRTMTVTFRRPCSPKASTSSFRPRAVPKGPAASFRCGQRGEVAGVVRVTQAGGAVGDEPSSGRDGLVLEYFLGTVWHAETGDVVDAVQALIEQGNVDPIAIREISWALWDITPFYCPE